MMDAVVIPPNPLKGELLRLYILFKLANLPEGKFYLS